MTLGELQQKIAEAGWDSDLPVELQDDYGREFTPEVSFSAQPYSRIVVHIAGSPIEAEVAIGAGGGSRPSWPVAPDGPGNPCVDPLGDAMTVLEHVQIESPSARPDTEDALNRVRLALNYLRMVPRG